MYSFFFEFDLSCNTNMKEQLIAYLETFVSANRINIINQNLASRTRYITTVLENIYQFHNASAVLRTCECLGIQDVHIIENKNPFKTNTEITLGSEQWLNIYKYPDDLNSINVIRKIKEKGYRIVATSSHANTTDFENLDLSKGKIAFVFGTELTGISNPVSEAADEYVKIPMYGFTESFNLSVSAAIILHFISHKLRTSEIDWKIPNDELVDIKLNWLRNSIKKPELIEKHFIENIYNKQTKK
jgi:tRNA (guanosine-2'-O-)-methyltransferase